MLKPFNFILLFVVSLLVHSCTKNNKNDLCPQIENCDTSIVFFSEDIFPVFEFNCMPCHSGGQPSGNLSLTNYQEIESSLNNGNIINRITRENSDNLLMPPSGKLDSCIINKIIAWKNQGSLNN